MRAQEDTAGHADDAWTEAYLLLHPCFSFLLLQFEFLQRESRLHTTRRQRLTVTGTQGGRHARRLGGGTRGLALADGRRVGRGRRRISVLLCVMCLRQLNVSGQCAVGRGRCGSGGGEGGAGCGSGGRGL